VCANDDLRTVKLMKCVLSARPSTHRRLGSVPRDELITTRVMTGLWHSRKKVHVRLRNFKQGCVGCEAPSGFDLTSSGWTAHH
jgi:hypothetical protein